MYNLIISNLYKGFKSKMFFILFSISLCFATLTLFLANGIAIGNIDASVSSFVFLFSDTSMLTLLGAMLASVIIGADFETKLFHHAIVAGYSRLQIVIGKAITFILLFILIMAPYFLGNFIAKIAEMNVNFGMQGSGFINIVNTATDESLSHVFIVFFVMLLIYVAQLSLAILLGFVVKKAMLIIPLIYVVSALSGQASMYAASIPKVEQLLNLTPFGPKFIALAPNAANHVLVEATIVSIFFIMMMVGISYVIFRKAELK